MLIIFNSSVDLIDFSKEVSLNTSDVTKFLFQIHTLLKLPNNPSWNKNLKMNVDKQKHYETIFFVHKSFIYIDEIVVSNIDFLF